ncbi:MAG: hypothetical protein WA741_01670 [Candidatus Sulfotelmatobacter sp.]
MLPKTKEANAAMCSVYDDVELLDWLRWSHENGPSFLRTIAEAVFTADLKNYNLLRPALLKLKETNPRTGWSRYHLAGEARGQTEAVVATCRRFGAVSESRADLIPIGVVSLRRIPLQLLITARAEQGKWC